MTAERSRKTGKKARSKPQKRIKKSAKSVPPRSKGAPQHSRVVLLAVDPYLIHTYWTLRPEQIANAGLQLGCDTTSEAVLRFHEVARHSSRGSQPDSFDVPIRPDAGNWYVHLSSSGKSYYADLGLKMEDGRFYALASSNIVDTPRDSSSTRREVRFMLVEGNYERIEQIPPMESPEPDVPATQEGRRDHGRAIATSAAGAVPQGHTSVDLAELSEKQFVCGQSSLLPGTPPEKTRR